MLFREKKRNFAKILRNQERIDECKHKTLNNKRVYLLLLT